VSVQEYKYVIHDQHGNEGLALDEEQAASAVKQMLQDLPEVDTIVVTRRQLPQDLETDLRNITEEVAKRHGLVPEPDPGVDPWLEDV
jgi:hypothetical protein